MTSDQIALIRRTWPALAAGQDRLTAAFYTRLFESDGAAAKLFAGVDMSAQRHKLAQSLAVVVAALDDPDKLLPAIAALGRRHAGYGVEHRHYDSVAQALLFAMGEVLGEDFSAELRAAWADAYAVVASVMRRALERHHASDATAHSVTAV